MEYTKIFGLLYVAGNVKIASIIKVTTFHGGLYVFSFCFFGKVVSYNVKYIYYKLKYLQGS